MDYRILLKSISWDAVRNSLWDTWTSFTEFMEPPGGMKR